MAVKPKEPSVRRNGLRLIIESEMIIKKQDINKQEHLTSCYHFNWRFSMVQLISLPSSSMFFSSFSFSFFSPPWDLHRLHGMREAQTEHVDHLLVFYSENVWLLLHLLKSGMPGTSCVSHTKFKTRDNLGNVFECTKKNRTSCK